MSNRFQQLQRAIHRVNLPRIRFHGALPSAVGTGGVMQLSNRHFPRSLGLDHPAELLPQGVGGQLDLIVVRCLAALIQGLQFRSHRGRVLQQNVQLFLQPSAIRIHATNLLKTETRFQRLLVRVV
jgi:hypothetical protein